MIHTPTSGEAPEESRPIEDPQLFALPPVPLERMQALQINPLTGISEDYTNEFYSLFVSFEVGAICHQNGLKYLIDQICESPPRKYVERYCEQENPELYNEKTRPLIARLDELVCILRDKAIDGTLTVVEFAVVLEESSKIIKGEARMSKFPEKYISLCGEERG